VAALLAGATFLGEEHNTDTYYDTPTYELSTQDIWLRSRNDRFVLKKPAAKKAQLVVQSKYEIEDEVQIRQHLNIPAGLPLKEALLDAGYKPLYTFTNFRKKYQKEGFFLDFDCAQLGAVTYQLCEIELIVELAEQVAQATERIIEFMKKHEIAVASVEGKLIKLIKMTNPDHFQALQRAHKKR
jgi:adenylate cyclase class IV